MRETRGREIMAGMAESGRGQKRSLNRRTRGRIARIWEQAKLGLFTRSEAKLGHVAQFACSDGTDNFSVADEATRSL